MSTTSGYSRMLSVLFLVSAPVMAEPDGCKAFLMKMHSLSQLSFAPKGTGLSVDTPAKAKVAVDLSAYPKIQEMLAYSNKGKLVQLAIDAATSTEDPAKAAESLQKLENHLAFGGPSLVAEIAAVNKSLSAKSVKAFQELSQDLKASGWSARDRTVADIKIPAEVFPVTKKAKPLKPVPFGKFHIDGREVSYSSTPENAKKLGTKDNLIYFGRVAKSLEHATALCEKYFTVGVQKGENPGHYDIRSHVVDKAQTSGFTNGSTDLSVSERFVRGQSGYGVVFVDDVGAVEIVNVNEVFSMLRDEKEILYKGSRSPERVKEAIIYLDGKPIKRYSNPNYVPSKRGTR